MQASGRMQEKPSPRVWHKTLTLTKPTKPCRQAAECSRGHRRQVVHPLRPPWNDVCKPHELFVTKTFLQPLRTTIPLLHFRSAYETSTFYYVSPRTTTLFIAYSTRILFLFLFYFYLFLFLNKNICPRTDTAV